MKDKLLYIVFLFLTTIGFSQSPLVKAEIDTTNIRIGEQFEYKITVNEKENVIIPKLDNLKGLEVVDSLKIDTINNALIKKYVLTGFDSGAFYIPSQQIFIKNQAHLTDSLLVNVATVPIDTTKVKKFPIKGIKGEPYQFEDFKAYIYWGLAILLIVITTLYFALKRSESSSSETFIPQLAPYQEALQSLKQLDEKLLWQNNKIKAFYSELTDIVRNYIERELNVPALEQTTNELVSSLTDFSDSNSITTDKETIKKLEQLLLQSDLVKFAKSKPLANEIETDRRIAELVINNVKPAVTEENTETSYSKPVVIVQKPEVKQPKLPVKILIIIVTVVLAGLISFGIIKALSMYNPIKQPVENVQ